MRHGQRLDDIEPDWRLTTDRPWDPPLSPQGLRQAREAAEILKRYKIDKLVSSPFVRCLQTAKELERELPNSPVAEIAFPFSEVLGKQFLTGRGELPAGPALGTIEEAHCRYAAALHAVAEEHAGKNVVIVTHGEAIGRSIMWLQPHAIVYQAAHCGFTLASRALDDDGQWGDWSLGDPEDMLGVLWTV
ncbi:hypothetical protein WJX84_005988 [Apatococcus fuscideae]|uniref:Phosphoglycerate mutase n=1 Tax=Apatococcus fuscideae TaxID=2026836 RepID=A0AAW1SY66_9CHLO